MSNDVKKGILYTKPIHICNEDSDAMILFIYKLVRMCPTAFEFNISSVFMVIASNVCISYVSRSFRNK